MSDDFLARARAAYRDPKKAAVYAKCEEIARETATSWLATHPHARPVVRSLVPVELLVATVSDARAAGVLEENNDGRALVDAVLAALPRESEPTVGQLVRAIDAARRVRP